MAKKAEQTNVSDWLDSGQDMSQTQTPSAGDLLDQSTPLASDWSAIEELGVVLPGQLRVLTPDWEHGHVCVWRTSRAFVAGEDGRGGRFEPVGFWSLRNSGGQRIGWEPVGWRPYEEERPYAPPAA